MTHIHGRDILIWCQKIVLVRSEFSFDSWVCLRLLRWHLGGGWHLWAIWLAQIHLKVMLCHKDIDIPHVNQSVGSCSKRCPRGNNITIVGQPAGSCCKKNVHDGNHITIAGQPRVLVARKMPMMATTSPSLGNPRVLVWRDVGRFECWQFVFEAIAYRPMFSYNLPTCLVNTELFVNRIYTSQGVASWVRRP